MSSRDWLFRIQDILRAIEKIEMYVQGMTTSQFKKNDLVIDAVVRNLEVIGEAGKSIPVHIRRAYPDIPWEEMNGMRNVLIHEYFGVDITTVWHTVKKHLPMLKEQLKNLSKAT
ncbi:MAG: DUF86 domain-containing protein [Chlamydiae bacterium]|nr:DUF86 domain-containing protein [Chlamydiota bacterium]